MACFSNLRNTDYLAWLSGLDYFFTGGGWVSSGGLPTIVMDFTFLRIMRGTGSPPP